MSVQLQIARRPAFPAAIRLLQEASLPTEDLSESHLEHFYFAGPATQPTGLVGLEVFGEVALLRSLVVAPARRGLGDARQLVDYAERQARARGVNAIYLLTTTAEPFFMRRGYTRADREAAPAAIRATREFAGICPASSAFMTKALS